MKRTIIRLAAIAVFAITPQAGAIVNGTAPDPSETRFDAVAAFGRTLNLTGQNGAGNDHNHFCNGTLITPTKMLMARHCVRSVFPDNQPPSGTFMFRFRRNPDGTLGSVAGGWESFHQVEVTGFTFSHHGPRNPDIVIAHLAEPVTHIEPIAIAPRNFLRAGMNVITAAWGRDATGGHTNELRMHTNLMRVVDPSSPRGVNLCSSVSLETTNGSIALHDSGGAFLVMSNHIPYPYDYIAQDDPYVSASDRKSVV